MRSAAQQQKNYVHPLTDGSRFDAFYLFSGTKLLSCARGGSLLHACSIYSPLSLIGGDFYCTHISLFTPNFMAIKYEFGSNIARVCRVWGPIPKILPNIHVTNLQIHTTELKISTK
jgi:hypothetical protein